jgi:site-specific DNA recombinase
MSDKIRPLVRCAIYTRKSSEEGLDQDFSSLDAQREACQAYVASQREEGWLVLPEAYDDGGFTGANMDRPALQRLLTAVEEGRIDCVVVYKADRLGRSIRDVLSMLEVFEKHGTSFVSITQQFNTTTSAGRMMLNMLLTFAQFEREMIAERTRDKMSAARRKGKWTGGNPVLGYDCSPQRGALVINEEEAAASSRDLPVVPGVRLSHSLGRRDGQPRLDDETVDHTGRAERRRSTLQQRESIQPTHQCPLHRAGQARRPGLRRGTGGHR